MIFKKPPARQIKPEGVYPQNIINNELTERVYVGSYLNDKGEETNMHLGAQLENAFVKKEKGGGYSVSPGKTVVVRNISTGAGDSLLNSITYPDGKTVKGPREVTPLSSPDQDGLTVIKDLIPTEKQEAYKFVNGERIPLTKALQDMESKGPYKTMQGYVLKFKDKELTKEQTESMRRSALRQVAELRKKAPWDLSEVFKRDSR